jgi:sigma-B regulation protein RsbU (phosphoserine phosphatase)
VNAGHNPPMVLRWRDGQCKLIPLETEGTPVGALEHAEYTSAAVRLEIGDVLIAYTDGITEAENLQGEFWGQQRLEKLLRSCHDRTPKEIIRCVLDEVSDFSKAQPQRDDVTLVVVRAKDEVKL